MTPLELAQHLENTGNFVESLKIYREIYVQNPGDEDALLGIANCALAMDVLPTALEFYVKLLICNHDNPWGYLGRAMVLFRYDQDERALSDVASAIALDNPASALRIDVAAALNESGYVRQAFEALRPLRGTHMEDGVFRAGWGFSAVALGRESEFSSLKDAFTRDAQDDPFYGMCLDAAAARGGDLSAFERLEGLSASDDELACRASVLLDALVDGKK